MAGWLVAVGDGAEHRIEPQVTHRGRKCGHRAHGDRVESGRDYRPNDMPVDYYRATPLQAVADAMRAVELGGIRSEWIAWIGVVLGLPGGATLSDLMSARANGGRPPVSLVEVVDSRRGGIGTAEDAEERCLDV